MGSSQTIQYILDPKKAQVDPISSKTILMNYMPQLDRGNDCQVIGTVKLRTGYRYTTDELLLLLAGKLL
jgi:hypothetical protein